MQHEIDREKERSSRTTDWDRVYEFASNEEVQLFLEKLRKVVENAPGGFRIQTIDYWGEKFGGDPYPQSSAGGSAGWCGAWAQYIEANAPPLPKNVYLVRVEWTYVGSIPIYSGHAGLRIEITNPDGTVSVFYLDNFLIGKGDHVFFTEDIPGDYRHEFPKPPNAPSTWTPNPVPKKFCPDNSWRDYPWGGRF